MIGEFLYSLQPQEAVSAPVLQRLIPGSNNATITAANVALGVGFVCPLDKVFLVTFATVQAEAGAGQNALNAQITIQDANQAILSRLYMKQQSAGLFLNPDFAIENCLVMPDEQIRFTALFDLAGVNNTIRVGLNVHVLPKGNLQLR